MAYLLDTGTLVEVLRSVPSRTLVRRLTTVSTRDRWTSAITVSQLLIHARAAQNPKLMQDVIRLVAAVKVAPFDLIAAQTFAKLRATVAGAADVEPDDVMIAAIALTQRLHPRHAPHPHLPALPHLRLEDPDCLTRRLILEHIRIQLLGDGAGVLLGAVFVVEGAGEGLGELVPM
ncbi:MAG: hypothetical protein R3F14_46590 [Polyangiaceae bacterium]